MLHFLIEADPGGNSKEPFWAELASLSLVEARICKSDFVDLLRRHANSIRRVHLTRCCHYAHSALYNTDDSSESDNTDNSVEDADDVNDADDADDGVEVDDPDDSSEPELSVAPMVSPKRLMIALAQLQTLNLHSFEISQDEDLRDLYRTHLVDVVEEKALVRFINNTGPSPFRKDLSYRFISTCPPLIPEDDIFTISKAHDTYCESYPDLDESVFVPKLYWTLRRVQKFTVWWEERESSSENYPTEIWLFQHHDNRFAYGRNPLEYFSDWNSDDDSSELSERTRRCHDVARETPFGPTFDAFCAERRWEPADPATLDYPGHATVLLGEGTTMDEFSEAIPQQRANLENDHEPSSGYKSRDL